MSDFTLDVLSLAKSATAVAATIPGIRHAYTYDDYPTRPPGMPNKSNAYHFTGFPPQGGIGSGLGGNGNMLGSDLWGYSFTLPLYCVVSTSANVDRSQSWMSAYLTAYPETFSKFGHLNGAITSGVALISRWREVASIPHYPAFNDFYIVQFDLDVTTKGARVFIPT